MFVDGTKQLPADWPIGDILNGNDNNVELQVEHCVESPFIEQVSQVEWHNWVKTQVFPLNVYPSGHVSTHDAKVGCL